MDSLADLIRDRVRRTTSVRTDATPGAWSWLDDARHRLDIQVLHRIVDDARSRARHVSITRQDLQRAERRVLEGGWKV